MTRLDQRIVLQREQPPIHTGGWTVKRDVTDELEQLRELLDRLSNPHTAAEINPHWDDIQDARSLLDDILGEGEEALGGGE